MDKTSDSFLDLKMRPEINIRMPSTTSDKMEGLHTTMARIAQETMETVTQMKVQVQEHKEICTNIWLSDVKIHK